jgi:A/G-specific adenine glycosylase
VQGSSATQHPAPPSAPVELVEIGADRTEARTLVAPVLAWYAAHQRDLPWRAQDRTAWGVLVSEVMLQQTPVSRVLPAWAAWMHRWPNPADLAAAPSGEAVRQWDRLGYPRRALRLHEAATVITVSHGGQVPAEEAALRALPGVGEYTAAAVLAFAFGQRALVLDTNVRRVLARLLAGSEHPSPSLTAAERTRASAVLPMDPQRAARWSVGVMELGALLCTATDPRCASCPVVDSCAWVAAGRPEYAGPARPAQRFAGTDRQARGQLMRVLREADGPVARERLETAWTIDPIQRERALDGLVADGLVTPVGEGTFALPGLTPAREVG